MVLGMVQRLRMKGSFFSSAMVSQISHPAELVLNFLPGRLYDTGFFKGSEDSIVPDRIIPILSLRNVSNASRSC